MKAIEKVKKCVCVCVCERERERERERLVADKFVSVFALRGWCTPMATLDSETQPKEKGRRTSLSILSLISTSTSKETII